MTSPSDGSAPGPRPPTSRTPAVSAGRATQYPAPCRHLPTRARGDPRRPHTEEEALQQHGEDARTPLQHQAGPAGAARLRIHLHLRYTMSVAHLSHVFTNWPRPEAARCRTHIMMPRGRETGPTHTRARRRAQEAALRDLVVSAVAEAHAAHAAASQDPAGSVVTFLHESALADVRAWNGAGTLTLLRAMHRILNALRLGLVDPEAALYGLWMEWRTFNQAGQPLYMVDALRLTGKGSVTALCSSAWTFLHASRTRHLRVRPRSSTRHGRLTWEGCPSWTRRSIYYICRKRTWWWGKLRYLWRARAR